MEQAFKTTLAIQKEIRKGAKNKNSIEYLMMNLGMEEEENENPNEKKEEVYQMPENAF